MMFLTPSLNNRNVYSPDGALLIVLKNCASVLAPCLVKLFRLCLSTSTYPSFWKYAYIQSVPKKGNRSNPSNYWLWVILFLGVSVKFCCCLRHVWHKALIYKLPSFGLDPSLCSFISNFLSNRSIAVVDGHYSSPKPINSGVPQGSVLSSPLFLLFINDLSLTQCPIHSYADDSTVHLSTSFSRRPNQKQVSVSCGDATERLTSDIFLISD